jgi:hypothetical protein
MTATTFLKSMSRIAGRSQARKRKVFGINSSGFADDLSRNRDRYGESDSDPGRGVVSGANVGDVALSGFDLYKFGESQAAQALPVVDPTGGKGIR